MSSICWPAEPEAVPRLTPSSDSTRTEHASSREPGLDHLGSRGPKGNFGDISGLPGLLIVLIKKSSLNMAGLCEFCLFNNG